MAQRILYSDPDLDGPLDSDGNPDFFKLVTLLTANDPDRWNFVHYGNDLANYDLVKGARFKDGVPPEGHQKITESLTSYLGGGDDILRESILNPSTNYTVYVEAGTGNDQVFLLTNRSNTDTVYGEEGDDLIVMNGGGDLGYGGTGNDILFGDKGGDYLDGGAGADVLDPGLRNNGEIDTLVGGAGADLFFSGNAVESFSGTGWDWADYTSGLTASAVRTAFNGVDSSAFSDFSISPVGAYAAGFVSEFLVETITLLHDARGDAPPTGDTPGGDRTEVADFNPNGDVVFYTALDGEADGLALSTVTGADGQPYLDISVDTVVGGLAVVDPVMKIAFDDAFFSAIDVTGQAAHTALAESVIDTLSGPDRILSFRGFEDPVSGDTILKVRDSDGVYKTLAELSLGDADVTQSVQALFDRIGSSIGPGEAYFVIGSLGNLYVEGKTAAAPILDPTTLHNETFVLGGAYQDTLLSIGGNEQFGAPADAATIGDNRVNLFGLSGNDLLLAADAGTGDTGLSRLFGGAGDDTLVGGSGDDILIGGASAQNFDTATNRFTGAMQFASDYGFDKGADLFVTSGGHDVILDFDFGDDPSKGAGDTLQFEAGVVEGDVIFASDPEGVRVTWGQAGASILLVGHALDPATGRPEGMYFGSRVDAGGALHTTLSASNLPPGTDYADQSRYIRQLLFLDAASGDATTYDKVYNDLYVRESLLTPEGAASASVTAGATYVLEANQSPTLVVDLDPATNAQKVRFTYTNSEGDTYTTTETLTRVTSNYRTVDNALSMFGATPRSSLLPDWYDLKTGDGIWTGGISADHAGFWDSTQVSIQLEVLNGSDRVLERMEVQVQFLPGDSFTGDQPLVDDRQVRFVTGTEGDDVLTGSLNPDITQSIDALGGDDTVVAGAGNSTLTGGDGVDLVDYAAVGVSVSANLETQTATKGSGATARTDTLIGFEGIAGGAQSDTLLGRSNADDLLRGNGGADTIVGFSGNDTISGGDGDDSLSGGLGFDILDYSDVTTSLNFSINASTVTVASGNTDTISGFEGAWLGSGNDTVSGDAKNNLLDGGGGDDTLSGGAGDDTLIGGAGFDVLDGGDGSDTANYRSATAALTVNLGVGTARSTQTGTDVLLGIENIDGGSGDDTLTGDANDNRLAGFGGNDSLLGLDGVDQLFGGDGSDTLDGGTGNDDLDGGAGNDLLFGGDGDDTLTGGSGDDTLTGGAGIDTADFSAFSGNLTISLFDGTASGNGNDTLNGIERVIAGFGNDTIIGAATTDNELLGGGGNDLLIGVGGNNTLIGGLGRDQLTGGSGNDLLLGEDDSDYLRGADGNDTLDGGAGHDQLLGGYGDDTLIGGAGDDALDGGAGFDTADFSAATAGLTIDLVAGTATGEGNDSIVEIEHVLGGQSGDAITGTDSAGEELDGREGNDTLIGNGGDDTLIGGAGDDTLIGGAGIDTADFSGASVRVLVDLEAGTASGEGDDILSGIERVVGSQFGDEIAGKDAGDDVLDGQDGNDTLIGNGGNDTLIGGNGRDLLYGGAGDDLLDGSGDDGELDFAMYISVTNRMIVDLAAGTATGEGNDRLVGIEAVVGGSAGDILSGSDAVGELLDGRDGDDSLRGNGGNDTLWGGAGNDDLQGGADNDTLDGGTGDDRLDGGAGDDTLEGSVGDDILTGGDGNDQAVYIGVSTNFTFALVDGGTRLRVTDTDLSDGNDGTDLVGLDVESLVFSDTVLSTATLAATVPVLTPAPGIFMASDASGVIHVFSTASTPGGAVHYSLSGPDAALFDLDPDSGELRFNGPGMTHLAQYQIEVLSDDGTQPATLQAVEVTWLPWLARLLPDATYEVLPDGTVKQTRTDAGALPWTTIEQVFDAEGHTLSRETVYDDGDIATTTFGPDGMRDSFVFEDISNSLAWAASYTVTFNDAGQPVFRSIMQDDGDSRTIAYSYSGDVLTQTVNTQADGDIATTTYGPDGLRDSFFFEDISGSLAWAASYTDTFNDAGQRVMRSIVEDDGGHRTLEWSYSGSVLTQFVNTQADGDIETTTYGPDGLRDSFDFKDISGSLGWAASYTDTFNDAGQRVMRSIVEDDGGHRTLEWSYSGSVLTQTVSTQADGDIETTTFGSDGLRDTFVFEDISGSLGWAASYTDTFNDAGQRVMRSIIEDAGGHRTLEWSYSGRVLTQTVDTQSDGDIATTTYGPDGLRDSFVFEDISDSRAWSVWTQTFDDAGKLIDSSYVWDLA
ncbi:calcium-binding protein [Limimaricola sp.]|uniref:calcium-binding protein n=1 Tax=Limimaricola sp. TaxID=2211665 RepID=UPI0025BD93A1|nr:calcium-binding protein [Limimaricola sp.]